MPLGREDIREKIKNELYDTLENMICELIEIGEPDVITQIDEIEILLTSLNGKASTKILNRLFLENEDMSVEEKQSMAYSVIKRYLELDAKGQKDWSLICDLYIESGNITQKMWYKKPILKNILEQDKPETIDDMNDKVSQIKYKKVGDDYMIICNDKYKKGRIKLNGQVFDKNSMGEYILWTSYNRPGSIADYKIINKKVFKNNFDISQKQKITDLIEQLNEKEKELKSKVALDEQHKDNKEYIEISSIENLLKIQYVPNVDNDNNAYCEFYFINSSGELEQIEPRRRKKIYR